MSLQGDALPYAPYLPVDSPIEIKDPSEGWVPRSEAQTAALASKADVLLFGGAAGSLKSATMLADAAQDHDNPRMRAYIFRRSYPELEELMDQAQQVFPNIGAWYNDSKHTWRWSSGAQLKFRYIEREKQKYRYQGLAASFIGFDESTHQEEAIPRYLMTRARSTDPNLRVRIRFATNPGNIGHSWHKKMFMGNVCPHCHPERAPKPGVLRWDARWPSDGTMLGDGIPNSPQGISVTFIPGNIADHNLLGEKYAQLLKMQSPATAKALLAGCWEVFEGQYFDCWEPNRGIARVAHLAGDPAMAMVQDWRKIGYEWWWPHWVGADYGFTISAATAYLFTRRPPYSETLADGRIRHWPKGRTYIVSEYVSRHEKASDFTSSLIKKWVLDHQGRRLDRRIHAWYLSPDSFRKTGMIGVAKEGMDAVYRLADQMNQVLMEYGMQWQAANDDRQGGAMKMYTDFSNGELVVCANCRQLIDSIASRVHDQEKENDVEKVQEVEDDCYDGARYGHYSHEFRGEKPAEMRVAEVMEGLDPTSAMIRGQREINKIKEENSPVVYGGKALARRLQKKQGKSFTFPSDME